MTEVETYYYVRFRWWRPHNLEKLAAQLKERFTLLKPPVSKEQGEPELSIHKKERNEIEVRADTLVAFLSPYRAVLFQRRRAPFTEKDVELREVILDLYPRDTPTPFPWGASTEPRFEKKENAEVDK